MHFVDKLIEIHFLYRRLQETICLVVSRKLFKKIQLENMKVICYREEVSNGRRKYKNNQIKYDSLQDCQKYINEKILEKYKLAKNKLKKIVSTANTNSYSNQYKKLENKEERNIHISLLGRDQERAKRLKAILILIL